MADRSVLIQRVCSGVVRPHSLCNALSFVLTGVVRDRVVTERRRIVAFAPNLNPRTPERERLPLVDELRVDIQVPSGNHAGEGHV